MWAIRRATIAARSKSALITVARAFSTESLIPNTNLKEIHEKFPQNGGIKISPRISQLGNSPIYFPNVRKFSTQSLDGFSDLDADESEIEKEEELADTEPESYDENKSKGIEYNSSFTKVLMDAPLPSTVKVLTKWIEDGNSLVRDDVNIAIRRLRNRRLYRKALLFMQWLESSNHVAFTERDYAFHLDLIAKVHGLQKAEKYLGRLPESFKTKSIYESLLVNCVLSRNPKKANEVFDKMKALSLLTTFACNQLLLLYKRTARSKIADVLLLMERESIKPSLFTYRLLIDTKGQSRDIEGMEEIIKKMKSDGVELDIPTRAVVASHYITGGLTEKAERILKEMRGEKIEENREAWKALLPLYASLGRSDDVDRLWQLCKSNTIRFDECLSAIEAWGKLGEIDRAEDVFETMLKSYKRVPALHYNALIYVYADHKLLSKGRELAKRMSDNGSHVGRSTWHALVKLYVNSGETDKAASMLYRLTEQGQVKPLFGSYIIVMESYAKKGDVHNSEKMFDTVKNIYRGKSWPYELLLEAYVNNGKITPYGFRDRMRADNVVPSKLILAHLEVFDVFKKKKKSNILSDLDD